jgi:hypothetical protein
MSNWGNTGMTGTPGGNNYGYGGSTQVIRFKDPLDAARAMVGKGRTPNAEYPDGYLGTLNSRRSDRLLDQMKNRLTQRDYQRGVHKGEKIDAADYFWPPEFNMQTGLEFEARGQRWTARGNPVEHLVNGGKPGPQDIQRLQRATGVYDRTPDPTIDPVRSDDMKKVFRRRQVIPPWSM